MAVTVMAKCNLTQGIFIESASSCSPFTIVMESEPDTEKSEAPFNKISKDLVPTQNSKRAFKSSNPNATVNELNQQGSPKPRQAKFLQEEVMSARHLNRKSRWSAVVENWEKALGDIDKIEATTKKSLFVGK